MQTGNNLIRLNKPIVKISREAAARYYCVYKIVNSGYASKAHSFLDNAQLVDDVAALRFFQDYDEAQDWRGSSCFVLLHRNSHSAERMHAIVEGSEEYMKGTLKIYEVDLRSPIGQTGISDTDLIGLLMNGTNRAAKAGIPYSNTSARLFRLVRQQSKDGKTLVCLEFLYKNQQLQMMLHTFASNMEDKAHHICYTSKLHPDFNSYTKYVIDRKSGEIRRKQQSDPDDRLCYIMRNTIANDKAMMKFFNRMDLPKFWNSKIGYLTEFEKEFNALYADRGIAKITGWKEMAMKDRVIYQSSQAQDKKALHDRVIHTMSCVNLCDMTGNQKFTDMVRTALKEFGYLPDQIISYDAGLFSGIITPTIALIPHDRDYYKQHTEEEDLYYKTGCGGTIQHMVTSNDAYRDKWSKDLDQKAINVAVANSLVSLRIKEDLADGIITLTDWKSLGFEGTCTFVTASYRTVEKGRKKEKIFDHYTIAEIDPAGHIHCHIQEDPYAEEALGYCPYMSEWDHARDIECAFIDDSGTIMYFEDTGICTMPMHELMTDAFKAAEEAKEHAGWKKDKNGGYLKDKDGNLIPKFKTPRGKGVSGQEAAERLYPSLVNMGYGYTEDGCIVYYIGEYEKGVAKYFNTAVHLRTVRKDPMSEGDLSSFERLFPSFENSFARYTKFSVLPFPVRYLREYDEFMAHSREE